MDEDGRVEANVASRGNVPLNEKLQEQLAERSRNILPEKNVKSEDRTSQAVGENTMEPGLNNYSVRAGLIGETNPDLNVVVKKGDGTIEVYPPNPTKEYNEAAKWTFTAEELEQANCTLEELVTKSPQELNDMKGIKNKEIDLSIGAKTEPRGVTPMQQAPVQDGISR